MDLPLVCHYYSTDGDENRYGKIENREGGRGMENKQEERISE